MIVPPLSENDASYDAGAIRVLLIAYACEPGRGSEPGTGWNMALGLAKSHQVTVATRANNRPVIEKYLATHDGQVPDFLFIDPAPWILRMKKRGILPVQLFYYFWQRAVAHRLTQQKLEFDILHQLTFNSFEIPPLAFSGSKGIKIWGPVGGGQSVPFRMLPAFGRMGGFKEWLRNLRVRISTLNPLCKRVLGECSYVLFANEETRSRLGTYCGGKSAMMIDVGVDAAKFTPVENRQSFEKLTILFAGRLEGRKGAILLLKAFNRLSIDHPNVELRIVGTGPMRNALANYVSNQQLSEQVIFTGLISHEAMSREFEQADIFAFPSLRDTSGAVVLEAMSMELPIVCFNHQGAALMVEEGCGIKVPAQSIQQSIAALKDALEQLVLDRELRRRLGTYGRKCACANHDWSAKVARIGSIYEQLLARS